MKFFRKNKKGFTLIEVIVVIAIIAILASIVTVSTIAVLRNSQKKAVTSKLTNYWGICAQAVHQINHGFSSTTIDALLTTRLGSGVTFSSGTKKCSSLKEGAIYIQYTLNTKSISNKYTLTCIWARYKDKYYYTTNGQDITGPKDKLS